MFSSCSDLVLAEGLALSVYFVLAYMSSFFSKHTLIVAEGR